MTENESIKELEASIDLAKMCTQNYERKREIQGYEMAINALEEIQQYRAIGTPEELQTMKEHGGFTGVELANIAAMQMKLKEYEAIGTPEECREAVEKQTARRPDYEGDGYADGHLVYDTWICHCCGKHYEVDYDNYNYCPDCGQKLDWSDEE